MLPLQSLGRWGGSSSCSHDFVENNRRVLSLKCSWSCLTEAKVLEVQKVPSEVIWKQALLMHPPQHLLLTHVSLWHPRLQAFY